MRCKNAADDNNQRFKNATQLTRTVLRNGRTLFIVTYIPCDAKTREDFNAQNNNRAQSHRCRRRASPRGSDTVVLILNCSMLLMIYTVLEPLRGLVLPLSYLHTDMTYLLTKRNCFYKALTEIWVIAWVRTYRKTLFIPNTHFGFSIPLCWARRQFVSQYWKTGKLEKE